MALPEAEVARVRAWCESHAPDDMREQMRLVCDEDAVSLTIMDERPPWDGKGAWTRSPVARLRFVAGRGEWTLYCVAGSAEFRRYDLVRPAASVAPLLREIDRDPTCIFWG